MGGYADTDSNPRTPCVLCSRGLGRWIQRGVSIADHFNQYKQYTYFAHNIYEPYVSARAVRCIHGPPPVFMTLGRGTYSGLGATACGECAAGRHDHDANMSRGMNWTLGLHKGSAATPCRACAPGPSSQPGTHALRLILCGAHS